MYCSIFISFLSLALATARAAPSNNSTPAPTVDLGYAKYKGIHNETRGIDTYYGIRFAAAPTGQRRWRTAVPIELQNNYTVGQVIDATVPGPQCVQPPLGATGEAFLGLLSQVPGLAAAMGDSEIPRSNSEDCLLLDVIVPSKAKSCDLPVVIQIHGGGYTSGNSMTSDGSAFVDYADGNIVWVQIQYRLGAYGFLGSKEILADGDPNLGLLDQRIAFDWVQKHIRSFGGDPDKVTIWGGSAGGGSVSNHLIIEPEIPNPPFRAAIAEFPWWQPYHDTPILELQYQQLLNTSNCSDLSCLRSLPEDVLANATFAAAALAQASGSYGVGENYYGPYIDGKYIRDLPSREFDRGNFHKVPLITDRDSKEGIFQNFGINSTNATTQDLKQLWPAANVSFISDLYKAYPLSSFTNASYYQQPFFGSQIYQILSSNFPTLAVQPTAEPDAYFWRIQELFGDFIINCPTHYMAAAAARAGVPAWKVVCDAGIYIHGAIGGFLLADSSDAGNSSTAVATADTLKAWYLSFVVDLDPNKMPSVASSSAGNGTGTADGTADARPIWPQYAASGSGGTGANYTVMQIEDTGVGAKPDSDASPRCGFFHSQSSVVRN